MLARGCMRVAVIGHSSLNIAPAVAADLGLRGFEVAWWPAPTAVAATLAGAEAVVIDIPATELLPRMSAIVESLPTGALVHVQSHGYWPAARLGTAFPGRGIVFADSSAPTHAAAYAEGVVTAHARRRGLRFACVGGAALATLRLLYPGATLANLAAFDRAAEAGTGFAFYGEGNTETAAPPAAASTRRRGHWEFRLGLRCRRASSSRTVPAAIHASAPTRCAVPRPMAPPFS